jgi:PBP1b-binding outer membrane lipoprotein LpoB
MKFLSAALLAIFLTACANEPPDNTVNAPTKAEIQKRDEFARNLPKPPER